MADVKILLVEDESIEAMDIKRTLESLGYEVPYVASSGEEAIEKALDILPDLILMDIILKGEIDGIKAASKIKELNIPIIYLTAHSEEPTIERAKLTEPEGYIIKPYDRTELKYAIELAIYKNKSEKELKESEKSYRELVDNSMVAVYKTNLKGDIIFANEAMAEMFNFESVEKLKTKKSPQLYKNLEDRKKIIEKLKKEGKFSHHKIDMISNTGEPITILLSAHLENNTISGMMMDITKREQAEETQRRLNRELQAISNCNQTLLRAVDEQTLLNEICRIICDEAGYHLAWVGYAEQDPAKTIRPVAWAGFESGYIENTKLSWSEDTEHGLGPAGIVIRSDKIVYVQDFATDPLMAPWRESALKRGYRSGIALPLKDEKSKVFGVLLIYSSKPNAINPDEIKLMDELAGDLAFGITALRTRTERKRAEKRLNLSESRLNEAQRIAHIGSWELDIVTNKLQWSDEIYRIFEIDPKQFGASYKSFLDLIHPEDRDMVNQAYTDSVNNRTPYDIIHRLKLSDGQIKFVHERCETFYNEEGKPISSLGTVQDITELKKAEAELQDAHEYLEQLISSANVMIIGLDTLGHVRMFNKAAERITGYTMDELTGIDWFEKIVPKDRYAHVWEVFQSYQQRTGTMPTTLENPILTKTGEERFISWQNRTISSPDKVISTISFGIDITERKLVEEALKKSEKRMRLTLEATQIGIWDWDVKNDQWYASPTYYSMLGYEPQLGQGNRAEWLERVHPDDRAKVKEKIDNVLIQNFNSYEYEARMRHADSTYRWVSVSGFGIERDLDGNATRILGIRMDITDRKRAEEGIIQAKEDWENTFDAVPDLITILDTNFQVLRANKAMADKLGVDPEETVGLTCYRAVHGLDAPPSFCPYTKLLEDGQEHTKEFHEDRIGGDFMVSVSPLYDSEGKLMGSVHVARDITDRKQAEEKIKRSLKEKEVLLSEIHHRVKNNMQIISSLLNLQSEYVVDDEAVNVLQASQDRVKAMATIYEKLSKSQDLSRIKFAEYIQSLVQGLFYAHTIKKGQINPIIEIEDIMLNIETALPCGLIISELISNSLKHAFPEGKKGKVCVSLKVHDNEYVLKISDDGIRFPEDIDFKNTDSLGLKLVNILVRQINGEITLDRNQGTEFKITFKELEYKERI
jgi:PAS domain S-box-containing protein